MNPTAFEPLPTRRAVRLFLAFALAYFLSTLIRAITATLAPTLVQEFSLGAGDLGLLAGGYFFGFALTQLPLGRWLDRLGPKRVLLAFLAVAVLACLGFAAASSFGGLLAARTLCGVGVSACLMAPLTSYRRWYAPAMQMRANSWMLMTGALGMVASTLPVQWLMPLTGWRPLFVGLGILLLLSMALIAWAVPESPAQAAPLAEVSQTATPLIRATPKSGATLFSQPGALGFRVLRRTGRLADPVGLALDGQGSRLHPGRSGPRHVLAQCGHDAVVLGLG